MCIIRDLYKIVVFLVVFTIFGCQPQIEEQKNYGIFQDLPFGAIKPNGWIAHQIKRDLDEGITGHFDKYGKTVTYDLFYTSHRISGQNYDGLKEWWSGEHEAYWKDGVLRGALLIDHEDYKQRAFSWMDKLLSTIDSLGYIGIYAKGNRYMHQGENGELWTQSRMIMPLIAYYQYTGDENIFKAIEKSVQLTISAFQEEEPWVVGEGGVSHGIGYFEVLEWLYSQTSNKQYADFALSLYEKFNQAELRDDDLKTDFLLDKTRKFKKHGAHIAEGFLVPAFIAEITKNDTIQQAANLALEKLTYHTTPSGAMVCDEDVDDKPGSSYGLYEYCANTEFLNPLGKIINITGDISIADQMEKMVFNALQGSRMPNLKSLSYLTSDNRFHIHSEEHAGRETYDAYHDAAACCALNAGRVMPYYIQHMWKKDALGSKLLALMYGPNTLETEIRGEKISIKQSTIYPFSDLVKFNLEMGNSITFDLVLRKPHGCQDVTMEGIEQNQIKELDDRIIISRKWNDNDAFSLTFSFEAELKKDIEQHYVQRGALVYAQSFEYKTDTLRSHLENDFHQTTMTALNTDSGYSYISESDGFEFVETENKNTKHPFDAPLVSINGTLENKLGKKKKVNLIPIGNTVIRQVSFKTKVK